MSDPIDLEFGRSLRAARKATGLSMSQVARQLGVTVTYISHMEAGRRWPSAETARRLAQICGADPDEFSVLAGHLPEDVRGILYRQPKDAVAMLRERFAPYHSHSENKEKS